jgi:hypothetical protein
MGRNEQADCKEKAYIFGNATRNHLWSLEWSSRRDDQKN